jgi:hypothetical protein
MIIVYSGGVNANGTPATPVATVIRPCPLISISSTRNKNKMGNMGTTYNITLNGTLLDNRGSPNFLGTNTPVQPEALPVKFHGNFNDSAADLVSNSDRAASILQKQNALRNLFAIDGQRVEVLSWEGNEPVLVFFPKVESISFEEGIYIDKCNYTINLTTDLFFDKNDNIFADSLHYLNFEPSGTINSQGFYTTEHLSSAASKTLEQHIKEHGGLVEDFSESWSLEPEENTGNTSNPFVAPGLNTVRGYRLTRNISAVGRTIYGPSTANSTGPSVRYEAWQQAKEFIEKKILGDKDGENANNAFNQYDQYPKLNFESGFASGFISLAQHAFGGYNHSRTENIDKTNGSYAVTDTWLLSSGTSYESYTASVSSTNESSIIGVSIDGTIRGLTSLPSSGDIYGGALGSVSVGSLNSPYHNAILKYREISNNGTFGLTSHIYKRASNLIGKFLNPVPLSVSLGSNEFNGEITYNVSFDTRPLNLVLSGVLSEKISIQDTYPGDIFATIPVIGRKTGPILQYIGGRTEYQRSVTIELTVDPDYGGTARQQLLLSKPSLNEPMRSSLMNVISYLSPSREPNIRKYFLSPPTESWDPKEKRYSISLNWTYELGD